MNLDSTLKLLQVVLGEAMVTSHCDVVSAYADSTSTVFSLQNTNIKTNGTTPVTAVAAPPTSFQRQVKEVRVFNNDTVTHTITLQLYDGTNTWIIWRQSVAANASFAYTPDVGVTTSSSSGGSTASKITGTFTADGSFSTQIPAGSQIVAVQFLETAGFTVSVSLGTASGGAQILAAVSVTANDILPVPDSNLLLLTWKTAQTVFIHSASWGGASINATIWYNS